MNGKINRLWKILSASDNDNENENINTNEHEMENVKQHKIENEIRNPTRLAIFCQKYKYVGDWSSELTNSYFSFSKNVKKIIYKLLHLAKINILGILKI